MPSIITRGAMSAAGFGFASTGALSGPYWMGTVIDTLASMGPEAISVDTNGAAYSVGYSTDATSATVGQVIKYDTFGSLIFQKAYVESSGYTIQPRASTIDSVGNIYISGYTLGASCIIKINSSGTVQWVATLDVGAPFQGLTIDISGNICAAGQTPSGWCVAQFSSAGTLVWQYEFLPGSLSTGYAIATDSSGNIYVSGTSVNATVSVMQIIKLNSSGTLQWQRQLYNGTTIYSIARSVAVDASGNVYVCGPNDAGFLVLQIVKYNTSGTLQWQRAITQASNGVFAGITLDSAGNIYACSGDGNLFKYNSSGSIQWQRRLSSSVNAYFSAIKCVGSVIYVTASLQTTPSGYYQSFIMKVPTNGSKTGSYVVGSYTFTYAAGSRTETAGGMIEATTTFTNTASSYPSTAISINSSDTTFTSSVTTL